MKHKKKVRNKTETERQQQQQQSEVRANHIIWNVCVCTYIKERDKRSYTFYRSSTRQ